MKRLLLFTGFIFLMSACVVTAEVESRVERISLAESGGSFAFQSVPPPVKSDAAEKAAWKILDGARDRNGGRVAQLHDGRVPNLDDQPARNFFFAAGTEGGRVFLDLGKVIEVRQVNTYSRHTGDRAPQVYRLYASDGAAVEFEAEPKRGTDPVKGGWRLLAAVDTRPADGSPGGQYAVSTSASNGSLGKYRYLLFDIERTQASDSFGNTFYSEIDVIDANAPVPKEDDLATSQQEKLLRTLDGKHQFSIDSSLAPDLEQWAEMELGPVLLEWFPKIVAMLPSDGFTPPAHVQLEFRDDMGGTPAAAAGNQVHCNVEWFRRNLNGEARGAVVHELVHVVQQYGAARRRNPDAKRPPGWLVEGIADYIRWFLYEPEKNGAEITARNIDRASYDSSYRITGNFIHWAVNTFDRELTRKLNAAAREGRYTDDLWKDLTGRTVQELNAEWKQANEKRLGRFDPRN